MVPTSCLPEMWATTPLRFCAPGTYPKACSIYSSNPPTAVVYINPTTKAKKTYDKEKETSTATEKMKQQKMKQLKSVIAKAHGKEKPTSADYAPWLAESCKNFLLAYRADFFLKVKHEVKVRILLKLI